jgi:hypothetical protein
MVLSILLGAVALFFIGLIIILISPFSFLFHCNYVSALESAWVKMSWLHPWVLCGYIEFKKKVLDIRLFNRFVVYSRSFNKEQDGPGPEGNDNASAEVPAEAFHEEAVSLKKATDASAIIETEAAEPQAEHLHSPSPNHEESGAAPFQEEKKKKEGPFSRLRSIREKFRNSSAGKVLFFLRQETWRHKIFRWLGRTISSLFRLFILHRIRIHVRASLEEPSATGKLYGYWMGISHALSIDKVKKRELVFEPAFNEECLEVEALLQVKTSLLRFMIPVIIMLVTFPYLSTFIVWRASKKNAGRDK